MFDDEYKQPIPRYIRKLGVVTAATGAAVRDIIQISKRRNPFIEIILYPAIVQGDAAPDSIVRGIRTLDQYGVDVIIIGRGGGSLEDLWAFNEERVAEAVFNCMTPVISAVGHETDTVITDFVADLRAPTPSAAAELAVFDLFQYDGDLASYRRRLEDSLYKKIMLRRTELTRMQRELHHLSPDVRIRDQRMSADRAWEQLDLLMKNKIAAARTRADLEERFTFLIRSHIADARHRLMSAQVLPHRMDTALQMNRHKMEILAGSLAHLSPVARLSGGYGFVSSGIGKALRSGRDIRPEDRFNVRLKDGVIEAVAETVTEAIELQEYR